MATPTLALIPTGYKAGKLYSVLPESGVGDFTVVRATEATRVNEEGLIETMGANVPRLDYSGGGCPVLLTEGQSTNLITYSEDFSNASWIKNGLLTPTSGFLSPSGDTSAFKIVEDTSTGVHRIRISSLASGTAASKEFTYSFFVKKSEVKWFLLKGVVNTQSLTVDVWFDLENGVIGTESNGSGKIENYGNDWYRCSINIATNSSATSINVYGYLADNNNSESYQGDGTSGLYIYGASLEQSSYPTSYIKTEGSAVTRNGDQVNGAGDAATFNDSEGVLMAEISALANDLTNRYIVLGTTFNNVYIRYQSSSNSLRCNVTVNGSSQFIATVFLNDETINSKISVKYKENDFSLYVDGFKLKTDLGGSTFTDGTLTELAFDNGNSNQFPFYGKTKQLQYFNTALNR